MNPIKKLRAQPSYKWVVVASCFLMVLVCLGFCSSTKSLYLSAITEALNMDRGPFSINDSVRYIATAVVNLFFGALIMRMGPRKMIGAGFVSLCASMLIYSVAENIFVFYLGGALLGVGLSWTTTTMVGYVVGLWCRENKGTIMGAVLAANGLGGAAAVQIVSPFINGSAFGYRTAYQITALLLLAVGTVVVLLFKDQPENQAVAVPAGKKARAKGWQGLTLSQCLRKPYFYAVMACVFLTGMVIQSAAGVYPSHMKDVGIDSAYVTTIVSVYSLCVTGTKFLTGFIYDKLGLRVTLLLCDGAAAATMLLLAVLTGGSGVLAMVFGVVFAVSIPLETIILPLITADMFGDGDSAHIMGILVSVNTAGYAVGTPLVNLFYDTQGTYKYILLIMCAVMVAVTVVLQFAITAAHKQRKNFLEE